MWPSYAPTARLSLQAWRSASPRPSCLWQPPWLPSETARGQGGTRWQSSRDLCKFSITSAADGSAVFGPCLCHPALVLAPAGSDWLVAALGALPGPGGARLCPLTEAIGGNFGHSLPHPDFLSIFAKFIKISRSRQATDRPLCAAIISAVRPFPQNRAS